MNTPWCMLQQQESGDGFALERHKLWELGYLQSRYAIPTLFA